MGGPLALAAAMLLTVANSPAPDPGIYCLDVRGSEMDAYAGYETFRSTDGGLTWESLPNQPRGACPNPWSEDTGASLTVGDPQNPKRQYRITPGRSIELSEDEGTSWQSAYQIPAFSQASAAATRRRLSSYAMMRPVPLDAKVDPVSGNAVFAMGHAGVLVQQAGGAWAEAAVGSYRPLDVNTFSDFLGLLVGEILLAVAIGLLAFDTLATRLLVRHRVLWVFTLVVAWLIWVAVVFLFPPTLTYGYGAVLTYGAMLVLGVILLVLTVIAVVGSLQHGQGNLKPVLGRPLVVAALAGLVFLLPYAVWSVGTVPGYALARLLGAAFGVAVIAGGAVWMRTPQDRPA